MALSVVLLVRGLLRGTVAQVFGFAGLVLGVIASSAVADWVGTHWRFARPEVVFTLLRWLVAGLCGLSVAAVLHWWGELLAKAAHGGPFGWLDRAMGALLGLATGLICCVGVVGVWAPGAGLGVAAPGGLASG